MTERKWRKLCRKQEKRRRIALTVLNRLVRLRKLKFSLEACEEFAWQCYPLPKHPSIK